MDSPLNLNKIKDIADKYNMYVVEDWCFADAEYLASHCATLRLFPEMAEGEVVMEMVLKDMNLFLF